MSQMKRIGGKVSLANILVVFLGGGLGATLRYGLSGSVYRFVGADFPYGTMLVNAVGSFLIGFLMTFFEDRFVVQPALRVFLTVGVLGGFTTFSTFSYETVMLMKEAAYLQATANILSTVLICLGGCWTGSIIGRTL